VSSASFVLMPVFLKTVHRRFTQHAIRQAIEVRCRRRHALPPEVLFAMPAKRLRARLPAAADVLPCCRAMPPPPRTMR